MEDSTEIKEIQLNMLKTFVGICEQENLRYYLIGGTCLGAVRHRGFIPWDDDIDVGMPRPDYERFLTIAQERLGEGLFLQTYKTEKEYYQNFAKLRDSNTTFIETTSSHLKINHGIYIDIFPLDGGGKTFEVAAAHLRGMQGLSKRIYMGFSIPPKTMKESVIRMIRTIIYLFWPSIPVCVRKREKLFNYYSFEDSDWVANYSGAWGEREIMRKDIFGEGSYGEFEGMRVRLPQRRDEYLTELYGDYMILPPENKRVGHHYCTVVDTEKSYKEYIK